MAKLNLTVTLEESIRAHLVAEAEREERSASNMLERILRERYGSALVAGAASADGVKVARAAKATGRTGLDGSIPSPPTAPATSADKITAAGANGDQPNPSDSAGAAVKEATLPPPRRGVASAKPKKKQPACADPLHGRPGWRCKACGEFTP